MSSRSLSQRRANLMAKSPHCHWCGRKLVYFLMEPHQRMPPDFATIDHLNSRLMYPDGRPRIGKQVLSCPGCNQDRNKAEQKSLGLEELHRRAHRYPRQLEPLEESARAFRAEVNQLAQRQ